MLSIKLWVVYKGNSIASDKISKCPHRSVRVNSELKSAGVAFRSFSFRYHLNWHRHSSRLVKSTGPGSPLCKRVTLTRIDPDWCTADLDHGYLQHTQHIIFKYTPKNAHVVLMAIFHVNTCLWIAALILLTTGDLLWSSTAAHGVSEAKTHLSSSIITPEAERASLSFSSALRHYVPPTEPTKQEIQLSLTNRATRFEVSQGYQTWYFSYVRYSFLSVCYSNFVRKLLRSSTSKMPWPGKWG